MIFAVIGILKQPVPPRDSSFEAELNDHLAQPSQRIVHAGYLRDARGELSGILALIEAESFEKAEVFLRTSPYQRGGYFESVHLAAYDVEIGRLT